MRQIIIGNKLTEAAVKVGEGLETKVNLIVGANNTRQVEAEKRKIDKAVELGVHTIIDLSVARIDPPLWMYGQEHHPNVAFGKVAPILVARDNNGEIKPDNLWKEINWSVESGIDYMTLNLIPMRLKDFEYANKRNTITTSRQGGVLFNYMKKNNVDNPYGPILNDMLALFKEYNVTIHIGSTFRPTGITEAYDKAHNWELKQQMEMFERFDDYGVQAIVEPFSHQPLDMIGSGIDALRQSYGEYVPFQMLGPITTEVNYNRDQYASAIGAGVAAMNNVGKITTIPPREHVGFPSFEDTMEGIMATLTAVHAGDLCRIPELKEQDREITNQRGVAKNCNPNSNKAGCNKCLDLCPLLIEPNYQR